MEIIEKIKLQIAENPVLLYMKGTPQMPQCGFSARAVQCLSACEANFAYINILENPEIRQSLPGVSNWPTFPQLFISGELIGGSDIIAELYEQGELLAMLQKVSC